jgi:hypothetical protein
MKRSKDMNTAVNLLSAHVSAPADAYTMTSGRLLSTVAALVALAGAIIGVLALTRRLGSGRRAAIVALVAGLTGIALGGWAVAAADGGPGTGGGIVGGFAALAIGLIAAVLGWLALSRLRRAA